MTTMQRLGKAARWTATGVGISMAAYRAVTGLNWLKYGHPSRATGGDVDVLLDQFMPEFEVAERHRTRIAAPAGVTLAAAYEVDLGRSRLVSAIFKAREWLLGSRPDVGPHPSGLVAQTRSLGWGVLAEVPGREIVMGAVTRPWQADVVFRAVPPEDFAAFREPGYAKIVWTLRAEPTGKESCDFFTETRVATTDAASRARFRRYWAKFSPGIVLIRRMMLRQLRRDAERRATALALSAR